jgi:hypothetical protein
MLKIVNELETFRNENVSIWKCNTCACWRDADQTVCTICRTPRAVLPDDDGPAKPQPADHTKRRDRVRSYVTAFGAVEQHKVQEREAKQPKRTRFKSAKRSSQS